MRIGALAESQWESSNLWVVVSCAVVGCTLYLHQRWFRLSALPKFSR